MAAVNDKNGVVYQNGSPIAGVAVRLYDEDGNKVGADTSDSLGRYSFTSLAPGNYQIRFFGEGFTSDNYVNFSITGGAVEILPIVFSGTPNLATAESDFRVDEQGEISVAQFSLTSLETSQGVIRSVVVEYKKSSESAWEDLKTFEFDPDLDEVAADSGSAIFSIDVPLKEKPVNYDFRASYLNGEGVPAKVSSTVVYSIDSNVNFNGIPDLNEIIGVTEVTVQNANANKDRLASNSIIFEWKHPNLVGAGTYYDAAGSPVSVTEAQIRNITTFSVYMFISDSGEEPSGGEQYPIKTETKGTWYLLYKTVDTSVQVRVPKKKYIMLWVGFQTNGTATSATETYYKY